MRPARHHQGPQPRLKVNAGASSPAALGDRMSPQRRVQSRSHRLHLCIHSPLLLVLMGCRHSSPGSPGDGIQGEGEDDGNVGGGDALW
jgi:hypothetical protein